MDSANEKALNNQYKQGQGKGAVVVLGATQESMLRGIFDQFTAAWGVLRTAGAEAARRGRRHANVGDADSNGSVTVSATLVSNHFPLPSCCRMASRSQPQAKFPASVGGRNAQL